MKKPYTYQGHVFEDNGHGDLYNGELDKFLIFRPYPMTVSTIMHKDGSVTMNKEKFKENTDANKGAYEEGYEINDDGSIFVKAEDVAPDIKEESEDNKSTAEQPTQSTKPWDYTQKFTLNGEVNDLDAAQQYLSDDDMTQYLPDELKDKIDSVKWSLDNNYEGSVSIQAKQELTADEQKILTDWIEGQNSDGLGEGFEQQDFAETYFHPYNGDGPYTRSEAEEEIDRMIEGLSPADYAEFISEDEMEAAIDTYLEDNNMIDEFKDNNWDEVKDELFNFCSTDQIIEAAETIKGDDLTDEEMDLVYDNFDSDPDYKDQIAEELWQNLASYEQADLINTLDQGNQMREDARYEVENDPESYVSDDAIYEAKMQAINGNDEFDIDSWYTMASIRNAGNLAGAKRDMPEEKIEENTSDDLEQEIKDTLSKSMGFEMENGDYYNLDYKDGKLIAGTPVNAGLIENYSIDYDRDKSVVENMEDLYQKIDADIKSSDAPSNAPSAGWPDFNEVVNIDNTTQDNYGQYTFKDEQSINGFAKSVVDTLNKIRRDDDSEYSYRIDDDGMIQIYDKAEAFYSYNNPDFERVQKELQKQLGTGIYFEGLDSVTAVIAGARQDVFNQNVSSRNDVDYADEYNRIKEQEDYVKGLYDRNTISQEEFDDRMNSLSRDLDNLNNTTSLRIVENIKSGVRYTEIGNGQYRSEKDGHDYFMDFNASNPENPKFRDVSTGKVINENSRKSYISENQGPARIADDEMYVIEVNDGEEVTNYSVRGIEDARIAKEDNSKIGNVRIFDASGNEVVEDKDSTLLKNHGYNNLNSDSLNRIAMFGNVNEQKAAKNILSNQEYARKIYPNITGMKKFELLEVLDNIGQKYPSFERMPEQQLYAIVEAKIKNLMKQ